MSEVPLYVVPTSNDENTGSSSSLEQWTKGNVQRFRGGLVFKAHRLLYHSTLGLRVTQKKKKNKG